MAEKLLIKNYVKLLEQYSVSELLERRQEMRDILDSTIGSEYKRVARLSLRLIEEKLIARNEVARSTGKKNRLTVFLFIHHLLV